MTATRQCSSAVIRTFLVQLLFALVLLAACTNGIGSIETEDRSWRNVTPIVDTGVYEFERYMQFAEEQVREDNPTIQLHSVRRVTPCHSVGGTENQSIAYSFIGTGLYYILPRLIWYAVWIDTEPSPSTVMITTVDTNRTWDGPIVDMNKLNIDYATAIHLARERGGSEFEKEHPTCWLVAELFQNQWLFSYGINRDELLTVCVEATSGDPCTNPPEWWLGERSDNEPR